MLLVVFLVASAAVIAGVSQLPFMGSTEPAADSGPALTLPKAEHVVVSSVDSPIVDITAPAVLVNGKRIAARPDGKLDAPIQPVIAALRALSGATTANENGFRRAVLRTDASTDAAVIKPVLASLHLAGFVDVVPGVQASGPCLSAAGNPLGSACQLAVAPLYSTSHHIIWSGMVIKASGYEITSTAGARIELPNRDGARDLAALRNEVRDLKKLSPRGLDLDVTAEPGVSYANLVAASDLAIDEGFPDLFLSTGPCFPRGVCFRELDEQR
jgi:hypothetical protein